MITVRSTKGDYYVKSIER